MSGNLLLTPNDLTSPNWGINYSSTGNITINNSPDNHFTLQDADSGNVYAKGQLVTIAGDTQSYFFQCKVSKVAGTGPNYPLLDIRYGIDPTSPDKYAAVVINNVAGSIVARSGWTPDSMSISSYSADYWLVRLSLANGGYTKIAATIAPGFNANASNAANVGTTGGPIAFLDPYLDTGTGPSGTGSFLALF